MESVFTNLISNAIKYVKDDTGIIKVSLDKRDYEVIITVSDNGEGMKADEIPMMFIKFFQGKNTHAGGTGIGLYLVKKFVELHKGNISVANDNGLNIKITLPVTGDNAITEKTESDIIEKDINEEKETLLIIDDNHEIVDFLTESLTKNYNCIKAYNGKEGLKAVSKRIPNLIIVDHMMPEMNGFEFTKAMRHNQQTASVPIIMLTAKDDMNTEMESLKIGVDVFISKPFELKKLFLHIAQLLQRNKNIEKTVKISNITNPEFKTDKDKRTPDEILIENITKVVEENMEKEEFNVTSLAQIICIDPKQLYRKVKQLTGMTPIAYLKKLRMKKAAVLLSENRFTVSEVMYLVGYTNASYFTKCFVEEFGITPKQFISSKL